MGRAKHSTPDAESGVDYSTEVPSPGTNEALELRARVEALLFVAAEPVPISRLSAILGASPRVIESALKYLAQEYRPRGISLQRGRRGVQLVTSPRLAADVQRFLNVERTASLSRPALEVLAIIAFRQPVTRPQVDAIRGVNSESVIHTLQRYDMVEEVGRSEAPGRPILYGTTPGFLRHFGMSSLKDLPPLASEAEKREAGLDAEDPR